MDDAKTTAIWAKRESLKLAQEWPRGSPMETGLLETWASRRPKMLARLQAHRAAEALAHVLVHRALAARKEYLRQGMPPTDAWETAEREWLLKEPEEEDAPEPRSSPLPPGQIIT